MEEYMEVTEEQIPLVDQVEQYRRLAHVSLINLGFRLVEDPAFRREIVDLGELRLIANEERYRDRMYRWSAEERRSNKFEELADYAVYDSSGPSGDDDWEPSR